MKALVIHAAKDLRIEEREIREPQAQELLINVAVGGICGSDLHYYNHGGFGPVSLKEPMILGHEVSGYVAELGSGVTGLAVGDRVAISPSRPCGVCEYCTAGLHNHCMDMRFYGSAMPNPHIQGAFRQQLIVHQSQCVNANKISDAEAATAEPFAVALHATKRAGDLFGKRVLVTGCGPIGVLAVIAARRAGAAEIVATDLSSNALSIAELCGADTVINMMESPDALQPFSAHKGFFDVMYECSGSEHAIRGGIAALRPRGILMQLGLGGDMTLPMMQVTAKEIDVRGSFRFHAEFRLAVELMASGLVDVMPVITHTEEMNNAEAAFKIAGNREIAMKTQIRFAAAA